MSTMFMASRCPQAEVLSYVIVSSNACYSISVVLINARYFEHRGSKGSNHLFEVQFRALRCFVKHQKPRYATSSQVRSTFHQFFFSTLTTLSLRFRRIWSAIAPALRHDSKVHEACATSESCTDSRRCVMWHPISTTLAHHLYSTTQDKQKA